MYFQTKTTPLQNITNKDCKALNIAVSQAEESIFRSSKRLGACLVIKGKYVLRGEST